MNIFFFLEGKHLLSFFYKDSKMFVEQSFFEKLLYLVNYLQRYKIFCIDNIAILPTSISEITKSYLNISDKFTVYSNTSFFIYNLAQDNIYYLSNLNKGMIIYQGFIGDLGVNNSSIILPVKFYYEDINYMDDMYMRCDGVYKSISSGVFSPKYVYSNLDVLRQMLINLDLFFNVNSKN